ncbi:MAG: hypothetical protein Q9190_007005 [Brigantiaea leucoxantha]
MSAGFGFSVGDVIAGLRLIKQSIEALQDSKGSSADCEALDHEIDSLKDSLEAVDDLHLDERLGASSKQSIAVREAIERCWRCIDQFLSVTAGYRQWLRGKVPSHLAWKANLKKIQWALCKKDDVKKFRAQLERHSSSINMLLVTLQVQQSFERKQQQEQCVEAAQDSRMTVINVEENLKSATKLFVGLSLEQRHLFQCLLESNNRLVQANEQINAELQQMRLMVQTQLEIPPQVALQRPVTLLDACGSISAFHLDFINCTEAFLAVLKIRFHQQGVNDDGIQMLENSQFVLQDHKGNIDLSQPWQKIFRPNQKVDMTSTKSIRYTTSSYWSVEDQRKYNDLFIEHGTDWASIAKRLQTKTPIMVKNFYHRSRERDRLSGIHMYTEENHYPPSISISPNGASPFHLFDMSAQLLATVENTAEK